jgi:hypothetical protein
MYLVATNNNNNNNNNKKAKANAGTPQSHAYSPTPSISFFLPAYFLPSLLFSFSLSLALLLVNMAGKLMHALQYDSYGGGAAGLKVLF